MGARFEALGLKEKLALTDYAWEQFGRLMFHSLESEMALHAQADPDGWRDRLCEVIASDPKRVAAVVESMERESDRRRKLFG